MASSKMPEGFPQACAKSAYPSSGRSSQQDVETLKRVARTFRRTMASELETVVEAPSTSGRVQEPACFVIEDLPSGTITNVFAADDVKRSIYSLFKPSAASRKYSFLSGGGVKFTVQAQRTGPPNRSQLELHFHTSGNDEVILLAEASRKRFHFGRASCKTAFTWEDRQYQWQETNHGESMECRRLGPKPEVVAVLRPNHYAPKKSALAVCGSPDTELISLLVSTALFVREIQLGVENIVASSVN